jgi:hypothetical protein
MDLNLEELNFIEKQLKFLYGNYFYKKIMNNEKIYIGDYEQENKKNMTDCRHESFLQIIKKYLDKPIENYTFRCNWSDYIFRSDTHDEFIITHSRLYNSNSNPIFFLEHYNNPGNWYFNKDNDNIEFQNKKNEAIWRGSTTGGTIELNAMLRYKIVSSNFNKTNIDIGFSNGVQAIYENNKPQFDLYFKPRIEITQQYNYKYIICLEGNDFATNFIWALNSNCVPLHNYPFKFETWIFGNGLIPFIHFIPIKNDGSDLEYMVNWCIENDIKCKEISENGKEYMKYYNNKKLMDTLFIEFFKMYPTLYSNEV